MSTARHLVYASDVTPGQGNGGRIIVDRHLRRLAGEGWSITIVTPFGRTPAAGPWHEIKLPARRWWWPPFRPAQPWLAALRSAAWRRELARAGLRRADAVLTVCWGPTSWLASSLARAWQCPLTVIVHDWWRETGTPTDAQIGRQVCAAARTVFAVSAEMQAALAEECGRAVELLYPLSATRTLPFATWNDNYRAPTVAHAGSLHPYHEEFLFRLARRLATVGGRLLLLCPRENPVAASLSRRCINLVRQDFFPANEGALQWVATNASALVVMYPHGRDAAGRVPTGFPSRFVEFSQLGLPVLLAAPEGNPVRSWSERRSWPAHCDPTDEAALVRWIDSLARADTWNVLATATRAAATGDFDPVLIHARFSIALTD